MHTADTGKNRATYRKAALSGKSSKVRFSYLSCWFGLAVAGVWPNISHALTTGDDTITPYASVNLLYDSNLLRVPNKSALPIGKQHSDDFIKQLMAGFDLDWLIGRQQVVIKANVNQNWFQNFSVLDYTGWNCQIQWIWQAGKRFNGDIGYVNANTLGNFSYLNRLEPNEQHNRRYFINAGYLFHPQGKIKFGLMRNEGFFADKTRQLNNNVEETAEIGLQYLSSANHILGIQFQVTDGSYPEIELPPTGNLDNAYLRYNYAFNWNWQFSIKTQLDGFVGFTEQHYQHLAQRNFAGFTGRLNLHWRPTDKTQLELSGFRDIYQSQNLLANFLIIQGVEGSLSWHPTGKIALKLLLSHQQQEYLGDTRINTTSVEHQKDEVNNVGLNLTYQPERHIGISAVANYENRSSNDPQRSYESFAPGINLKLAF